VTDPKRTLWYLKKVAVLAEAGPDVLARLSEKVELREVRRRDVVFLPGDPSRSLYFVCGGRLKICKVTRDGKSLTPDRIDEAFERVRVASTAFRKAAEA